MKGRKLTLSQLYEQSHGTKLWIERKIEVSVYSKNFLGYLLIDMYNKYRICFSDDFEDYAYNENYFDNFDAYEWIKDDTPLHKMSVEIVNLRGLDLTDENIRLIVEEFEEEK